MSGFRPDDALVFRVSRLLASRFDKFFGPPRQFAVPKSSSIDKNLMPSDYGPNWR